MGLRLWGPPDVAEYFSARREDALASVTVHQLYFVSRVP
jgi:hypothetical protein